MNVNPRLKALFQSRAELAKKQQELETARGNAQLAVDLCIKLSATLPAEIAALEVVPVFPVLSYSVAPDDALNDEVERNLRAINALKGILRDLPGIKKFWEKKLAALAA